MRFLAAVASRTICNENQFDNSTRLVVRRILLRSILSTRFAAKRCLMFRELVRPRFVYLAFLHRATILTQLDTLRTDRIFVGILFRDRYNPYVTSDIFLM